MNYSKKYFQELVDLADASLYVGRGGDMGEGGRC